MDHGFPHRLTQAAPALLRRSFGPDGLGRASRDGFGRSSRATPWDGQDPIREELFSAGRLDDHARSLAAAQRRSGAAGHAGAVPQAVLDAAEVAARRR